MYELKTVTVHGKGKQQKKDVLVAEVSDERFAIIGAFLMTDAPLMNYAVLKRIDAVLTGEETESTFSGNRCSVTIKPDVSELEDLFAGMGDDVPAYETCEIETERVKDVILKWKKDKEAFAKSKLDF